MKPKHIHIIVIIASVLVSAIFWFNLRARSTVRATESQRLKNELELAQQTATEESNRTEHLKARVNESVDEINQQLAALSTEKQRLAALTTNATPVIEAELPYRWDDTSPTARVGKRFLKAIRVRPLSETPDGDYLVDAVMAAALSMTPEEYTAVNESLDVMVRKYRELEKEQLIVTDEVLDPEFNWINNMNPAFFMGFHVPANPEQGEQIRGQFTSELNDELGPSRTEMFMELGEEQFKSQFGSFGQAERWLYVAERLEPGSNDINLNVFEKTSNGHYYNVGMGIPRELIGQSGPGIPGSWKHLIEGHYVQGQSLGMSVNRDQR